MTAAVARTSPTLPPEPAEPRVLLRDVPWAAYIVLRDAIESASVRMTYLEGLLEIMSPSSRHEVEKKQIARLIELFALERDIPLYAFGSTTFREEAKRRGLEPDECYTRGENRTPPDFAIEVVISSPAIDKLEVYRGLGMREIWIFDEGAFRTFALRGTSCQQIDRSEIMPELDLGVLAAYARRADQHQALREYRDRVRTGA